jgi:hypothetical protein
MHATAAAPLIQPPHAHRRPVRLRSSLWRIIRSILAALGAVFIVFMVLGLTLGSRTAADPHPAPVPTVTVTAPAAQPPWPGIYANHAVVNINAPGKGK